MKQNINVFWFKRDLRLIDNQALIDAINSKTPLLLLYLFEPKLIDDNHTSKRHINFIKETYKHASQSLWELKRNARVKKESLRILKKHTNANRSAFDD